MSPSRPLLQATSLHIDAPGGRPLFRGLKMQLDGDEKVAILGRNGVGKSTLLEVLAGQLPPKAGQLRRRAEVFLAPQHICADRARSSAEALRRGLQSPEAYRLRQSAPPHEQLLDAESWSHGQRRLLLLWEAFCSPAELLLLDEPTDGLDDPSRSWLQRQLELWPGGLLVASHHRSLLRGFEHFVLLSEAGGRYFHGSFEQLERQELEEARQKEKRYARTLQELAEREWHNARVTRRRARKRRLGRIHEVGRAPSRALLNTNRSYAQVSQGRAARIRQQRQEAARAWARSTRKALDARLELSAHLPTLPPVDPQTPVLSAQGLRVEGAAPGGMELQLPDLRLFRQKIALQGPSGSGKTTALELLSGRRSPDAGRLVLQAQKIGYIAQGADNWRREQSLVELLPLESGGALSSLDDLACWLHAHRFPLALAQRSLATLSPGERLRAALLCLWARQPIVEALLLDEPTHSLDFLGYHTLCKSLARWPGALVIASHDEEFLEAIGATQRIHLGSTGLGRPQQQA